MLRGKTSDLLGDLVSTQTHSSAADATMTGTGAGAVAGDERGGDLALSGKEGAFKKLTEGSDKISPS